MKSLYYYEYPVGTVGITVENGAVSHVFFGREREMPGYATAETPLIQKTAVQLAEYFCGKRKKFDLPLAPQGTSFQQQVWKILQTIAWGETRSYKDVATLIGKPQAARAVGMANHRNPLAIIIPCHRVIGKNGDITGYVDGPGTKLYLLNLERKHA